MDLPAPLGTAFQFEALAKCPTGQRRLLGPEVKGPELHQGVRIGLVHGQDALVLPPRLVPAALQVRLASLAIEPVDLGAMALGMEEPDPPERVAEARQPVT